MQKKVREYIKEHFPETVRFSPEDRGTLTALPYPYTVPSPEAYFQEMYYWDTFFTDLGLAQADMWEQCRNNTDNLLHQIKKYGYVPNGNRTYYLRSSQPPYLSLMARHYYEHSGDREWLKQAVPLLKREYRFWIEERTDETGLAHYGCKSLEHVDLEKEALDFQNRLNLEMPVLQGEKLEIFMRKIYSCCESGWDFSTRFDLRAEDFIAVDLNCLLYFYEMNFAFFERETGISSHTEWEKRAQMRKKRLIKYCRGENGVFFDYDRRREQRSDVISCAAFFPYWTGIETERKGLDVLFRALEKPNGIAATDRDGYQWDGNNIWAPLQWIPWQALKRMGEDEAAERIRMKYMTVVETVFAQTGMLYEKYPAYRQEIGKIVNENDNGNACVPMLGWSAGVYLDFAGASEQQAE